MITTTPANPADLPIWARLRLTERGIPFGQIADWDRPDADMVRVFGVTCPTTGEPHVRVFKGVTRSGRPSTCNCPPTSRARREACGHCACDECQACGACPCRRCCRDTFTPAA